MTASPSVLSVIAASELDVEEQAFIAACSEGEVPMTEGGGASPFTVLYSGGRLLNPTNPNIKVINGNRYWEGGLSSFPNWGGATVGQLVSTAAGLCQDTRTTFQGEAAKFHVTDFTPASQVEFNIQLARSRFTAASGGMELIAALKAGASGLLLIPTYLKATGLEAAIIAFPSGTPPIWQRCVRCRECAHQVETDPAYLAAQVERDVIALAALRLAYPRIKPSISSDAQAIA